MAIEFQPQQDKWVKCISNSGTIRAVAVNATEITNYLAKRHNTALAGTKSLSEGVIASLLLSSYCKDAEKINLNIQASGWCHQAIFDANANAEVRGYVIERNYDDIQLAKNVGPWGIGLLSVLRTKTEESTPYIGTVPLLTGHLPKDLTYYWLQSEQVHSAVGIDVQLDFDNNTVTFAQGFLIQALPGATDEDLQTIEDHMRKFNHLDPDSAQRKTPTHLLSFLLENQAFSVLEEKPLCVKCTCSLERVRRSIALVGPEEIDSMIEEAKDVEVNCDFCSEKYTFTVDMLAEIGKNLRK
jgi:molecular chaperone Hsp33